MVNHKISFNLSVEVAIFLAFHNTFMMLFHILMSVLDHELMLDNFLITSRVQESIEYLLGRAHLLMGSNYESFL